PPHRGRHHPQGIDRLAAQPRRAPAGMPLPPALSAGDGTVPHPASGSDHAQPRPPRRLLRRQPRGPARSRTPRGRAGMTNDLLSVENVTRAYALGGLLARGYFNAVEDVSFAIPDGKPEIFTIVGESGSGKS